MPHLVRRAAIKQIADEAVSVCAHRDELDGMRARPFDDLGRRLSHRQHGAYFEPLRPQFGLEIPEVGAVSGHTFSETPLLEVGLAPGIRWTWPLRQLVHHSSVRAER